MGVKYAFQLILMLALLFNVALCKTIKRDVKALNEIKASLGWRVVYSWVGDDPCGDGGLPPWSGVTCTTQGDYRVVTALEVYAVSIVGPFPTAVTNLLDLTRLEEEYCRSDNFDHYFQFRFVTLIKDSPTLQINQGSRMYWNSQRTFSGSSDLFADPLTLSGNPEMQESILTRLKPHTRASISLVYGGDIRPNGGFVGPVLAVRRKALGSRGEGR
ncbi:hypothetical protein DCAR_0205903 [Daucus carota subsp. sativus]|uniref:Uncharacterized protein n=1 Tax=Daucus carota subsp. sativus TaxID=79200 RepID=A0A161Y553_DAUCS|nr:hypothetical protein DCAR_0205903 [Daucus carota subsp. sativus]